LNPLKIFYLIEVISSGFTIGSSRPVRNYKNF